MEIHRIFPTLVGTSENPNHFKYEKALTEKCLELETHIESGGQYWVSNTYNTLDKYDIFDDKDFKDINKFVTKAVREFCDEVGINKNKINERPGDSWFNIYKKGDFQEYHVHPGSVLSVVYYLKVAENCSRLFFKSPVNTMQLPEYIEHNMDNFGQAWIDPKPGLVVIFRSHLEHMVEQQTDDNIRISLAYNYQISK